MPPTDAAARGLDARPAAGPAAGPGSFASFLLALNDLPAVRLQSLKVYPGADLRSLRRRLAFRWSAFRHPRGHHEMAAFFSQPTWAPIARAHPQLLQKVHKPFALRGLDLAARIDLVRQHYTLAAERIGPNLLAAVAAGRDVLLCRVPLPDGRGELPVWLGKQARFEREGELTVSLHDPFGSLLYSACFTLRRVEGEARLLVGSLNGTAPRETLRHLTRLSHGLRPQSMLVMLLQRIAAAAGVARIEAVGRDTHAYWGNPRHAEIRFDYDAFWREEGGLPDEAGLYQLPGQPRRRASTEVPAHKRALYARRYAWLDEVARRFERGWADAFGRRPDQNAMLAEAPANQVRPGAGSK